MEAWLLRPAATLAGGRDDGETDAGMALFALELMFFEPHGQYLLGQSSRRASRDFFCTAFNRFLSFAASRGVPVPDGVSADLFYTWARCGLFHSATLNEDLLVDALGYTAGLIARNPLFDGWLVNPWRLLPLIQEYLLDYVAEVRANPNAEIASRFARTFERLVATPMQTLAARANAGRNRKSPS